MVSWKLLLFYTLYNYYFNTLRQSWHQEIPGSNPGQDYHVLLAQR